MRAGTGPATTVRSCSAPTRRAIPNSVTAVLMPEGHNAEAMRKTAHGALQRLARRRACRKLGGTVFRIGHLGDLNEPMVLGTLASVEMALRINGVPHAPGGVDAAIAYLAQEAKAA